MWNISTVWVELLQTMQDVRTREIKCGIVAAKEAFKMANFLSTSALEVKLKNKLVKIYIRSTALCGAETWTLRKVDQKYLGSFEMWCWRGMEKISWTDRVRNEEMLHRDKGERNILYTVKRRKANWIGRTLRGNCLSETCYWR